MAFVRQRFRTDCGIAALAMLCDVTYEEAETAIPWRRHGHKYGTDTKQLRAGGIRLGYRTVSTPQHQLKRIAAPRCWGSWSFIPDNSLVKIPAPHGWHWVAWRKGKVYDPTIGVFAPDRYPAVPTSYMEFIKC